MCAHKQTQPFLFMQVSVMAYGAFVNIGAKTDGLVHISQLGVSYPGFCNLLPAYCPEDADHTCCLRQCLE